MKTLITILILLATLSPAAPQIGPPKRESRWHHIFNRHRDSNNLQQRFADVKCALVLIQAGNKLGTGFYVNGDGDVATASHVLGDRVFSRLPDSRVNVALTLPRILFLTDSSGQRKEVSGEKVDNNPDAWLSDVALIKTGTKTDCWLRERDAKFTEPGEHLIAMGFPGLSFGSLTIYTGIMSARLTTNLPTIILVTGEPVRPPNDFVRVQMPISGGLSGAPVIDDENRAIGIVTNAGGWTQDLETLTTLFRMGAFQLPAQQPSQGGTVTINSLAVTAELASLFHDYASPGYGDAVPLRYLRKQQQQNRPSASRDH